MSDLMNIEPASQPALDLPDSQRAAPAEGAMPAVSLDAVGAFPAPETAPPTLPLPDPAPMPAAPASPLLRAGRMFAGISALGAAWGLLVVLALLAGAGWDFAQGSSRAVAVRVGVGVAAALGVVWLAVAVIACLLAGAYCVMLAVTRRSW